MHHFNHQPLEYISTLVSNCHQILLSLLYKVLSSLQCGDLETVKIVKFSVEIKSQERQNV